MASIDFVASILKGSSKFLATPIERHFDPTDSVAFAANHWNVAIGFVAIYIIFINVGTRLMAVRTKPFELRMPLACWNAFLCLFSFVGMCRTVPFLLADLMQNSFESTICTSPIAEGQWGSGPTGFWVMLFIFSKIPELIDTVFIVLRKRPLIFLHWYHHVTVLLFCWSAYSTMASSGLYFVAMNYAVHALMYGYYCLQALKILQMFVGTGVCCSAWYFSFFGSGTCHNELSNLIAGAVMYSSYLYLFTDFALKRYIFKSPKSSKGTSVKKID